MNNYFLDQNIQNTFYTLHKYWIKNYPNATLTIGKQTTITDNSRTHTIIRPKKTTTRREKIGSKINKYLLESITAAILTPSITIRKMIKKILPIDKNLSYGRQLELYGHLGEIIEEMKLIKKTTLEIQVEILGIIRLDIPRVLTIVRRAKTLIERFGLLDTKLILPQALYTLFTKDFNKLVSFELDKTLQLEYLINSLISPELNLFGEDNVMIVIIDLINDLTVDLIIDLIIDLVVDLVKTTTKREKIGSKMDKYLLESITAAILVSSITIGKTIKEILPIDKNLSYERQLELYGHLGEIIEDIVTDNYLGSQVK
ncbi:hypothetical protein G9A89_008185 [Geosiphon pyriformis]|nr:hypothetical protein G9A89_008185 [Geosiphon pyriformis]